MWKVKQDTRLFIFEYKVDPITTDYLSTPMMTTPSSPHFCMPFGI